MRGRRGRSSSPGKSVSQEQNRMPLRKQIIKDAGDAPPGSQRTDEDTQEDEALDDRDDNDELSSSLLSPSSSREKRRRERGNKSKPKEMTEEEMMDLALRLSEQEASITALKLQKEEEAVMKAIQESMVGQTQPCPPSQSQSLLADAGASLRLCSRRKLLYSNRKMASAIAQGASEDGCTPETDPNPGAKGSGDESNNRNKKRKRKEGSPLLEMPDLSQTQASPCSSESLSVALDSPQDSKTDRNQDVRFNKSSTSDDAEGLNEISKDQNSAETELTSDMTLVWSEEDEDATPVGSPSPVFPEERPVHRADGQAASLNHVTAASPGTNGSNCRPSSSSTSTSKQQLSTTEREPRPVSSQGAAGGGSAPPGEPAGGPSVHYYWGVPFCPRGLDPDSYTQVILAQMEVYEKSLKRAQRCLLRKAKWGEAVLPEPEKSPASPESPAESPQQPVPRRRGLRLGGKKTREPADASPAEAEEEGDKKDEEEERENKEEKKNEGEGRVDTDDCEVCPETQLSDDDDGTQDLMMATDAGAELTTLSEVEMILRGDSPAGREPRVEEEEEGMEVEVDGPVDRKTKGTNIAVGSSDVGGQSMRKEQVEEDGGDPDVKEIKDRGLQGSTSPELDPAAVPRSPGTNVDCPICQGSFPATEIEMHAAYCDGEVAVVDERRPEADYFHVSLKPRRKRARRAAATAEETDNPSHAGKNQEKCYICQKAVALGDYSRHTELCIQRQASKTAAKGNLLSALEQTESKEDSEAGPSGSKLQPGDGTSSADQLTNTVDVIDLRDDDDDEEDEQKGGVSALRISNSPIRAFTPISEATGCLIDFKKQQRAKKLSQRRR
ncbi:BRCA1-A complex subunit RAP80 isoform X6 [Siniperca chuatsi]|uniref:BRCA1-A complex subunit RAP80 isoform X6 n=1 Tax=Siniperca chuatsi TaxID=119488 RepID=UPI001CE12E6B|nr:BRCA1-A complex subunit RAP80 isoform X6 [Siniperca chuatsi]